MNLGMKLTVTKEQLAHPGGLEIAVAGFAGDGGVKPTQVFIEYYEGKLLVHVWDGTGEDCVTHQVKSEADVYGAVQS